MMIQYLYKTILIYGSEPSRNERRAAVAILIIIAAFVVGMHP